MNTPSYLRILCSLALILLAQGGRAELPDLQPIDFQVPAVSKSPAPAVISYSVTFTNNGTVGLDGFWVYKLYWSADASLDSTDVEVGSFYRGTPIPPGGTLSSYGEVTLPAVVNTTNGWIILKADAGEELPDSNRVNNVSAAPFSFELIEPDLHPFDFQVPSQMRGYASPTISYSVTFTNGGAADLTNLWVYKLYWSADDMLDSTDVAIGSFHGRTSILVGDTWVSSGQVTAGPIRTHTNGWIILKADAGNQAPDSDRGNNVVAMPLSFELLPASDLRPINLRLTNSTIVSTANPEVTASWDLTNSGPGDLTHQRVNYTTWLSTNADMSNATLLEKTTLWGTQAVHQVRAISSRFVLRVARSGRYYLSVSVDPDNEVPEADDLNNTAVIPFDFELHGYDLAIVPGLTYTNLTSSVEAWVDVTFSTFNAGSFAASNWNAAVYFSTNAILDGSDVLLRTSSCAAAVGEIVPHSASIRLPVTESGRYYLIEASDSPNWVPELNESNNTQVVTVELNILYPDLEPVSLEVPATYTGPEGGAFSVTYTLTNHTPAVSMGHLQWFDEIYLSTNGALDDQSILLAGYWNSSLPGGFSELTITNDLVMPAYISGNARIFVRVNAQGVRELGTNNNVMSSPIGIRSNPPDLMPFISSVPSLVRSFPPPSVTVAWGITNAGPGTAVGPLVREIYFSRNATLERESDVQLLGVWDDPSLNPGEQRQTEDSVSVPVTNSAPGYLIFTCYRSDFPNEVNSSNNTVAVAIQFDTGHFDLVALPIVYTWQLTNNAYYNVMTVWGVSNAGPDKVEANWPPVTCSLVSSRDSYYDSNDLLLSSVKLDSGLSAGDVLWFTNYSVVSMTNVDSLHLLVCADATQELAEVNERNNITSVLFAYPDLAAAPLNIPSDLVYTPYSPIIITLAATNIGPAPLIADYWRDDLWISRKPALDNEAIRLTSTIKMNGLAPGEGYAATETVELPITEAGTYYLIIKAGEGICIDANWDNNLVIQPINVQLKLADLQPVFFQGSAPATVLPNPTLQFVAAITNNGPGAAYPNYVRYDSIVLSRDAMLDRADKYVGTARFYTEQPPGTLLWFTNEVTLPITESGTYYVFCVADNWKYVPESDESNNEIMTAVTLVVTPPDLAPVLFDLPPVITDVPYPWVELAYAITNHGPGLAQGEDYEHLLYFADAPSNAVSLLTTSWPLPVGEVDWRTNYVRLPFTKSGTYDVVFEVNPGGSLFESTYTNNTITNRVVYTTVLPNLSPVRLTVPRVWTIPEDLSLTVSYGITNSGPGMVIPNPTWKYALFLSTDDTLSPDDLKCSETERTTVLASHSSSWASVDLSFPGIDPGVYYLLLAVNVDKSLIESSTDDNVLAVPITIRERKPDLVPQQLIAPTLITNPIGYVTFSWYVMNQGLGGVKRDTYWTDRMTFCPTPESEFSLPSLFWETRNGPLPPGIGYWATNTALFAATEDSDGYFVLHASRDTDLCESTTVNNTLAVPVKVRLSKPDLAISDVEITPAIGTPGEPMEVRWGITNSGPGATRPDQPVKTRISYSRFVANVGLPYHPVFECPPLPPGGSAHFTNTMSRPYSTANADLVFFVDPDSSQVEVTRTNNQVIRTIPIRLVSTDLAVSIVSYPTNLAIAPFQPIQVVCAVTNIGTNTAHLAHWHSLSISDGGGKCLDTLLDYNETRELPPGQGLWLTNVFQWFSATYISRPVGAETGHARTNVDPLNSTVELPEGNPGGFPMMLEWWLRDLGTVTGHVRINVDSFNNTLELTGSNTVEFPMELEWRLPDLAASLSILQTNAVNVPEPSVQVRWALTNLGPGDFYADSGYRISFGVAASPTDSSFVEWLEISYTNFIRVGDSFVGTNEIPIKLFGKGLHYLVMSAPYSYELITNNNTATATLCMDNQPDLTISTLIAPAVLSGAPNQQVTIIAEVKNQGTGRIGPGWRYVACLDSPYLGYRPSAIMADTVETDALNPGESQWFTNVALVPSVPAGNYRWFAQVYAESNEEDIDNQNDSRERPVQVNLSRPSQLRAISLTADAKATLTAPLAEIRWSVVNEGDGPAGHNWFDSVYYSLDSQLSLDDTLVCTRTNLAGLGSGADYSRQTLITLPSDATSGAFLILVVDGDQVLWDEAPVNNRLSTILRIAPFGSGRTWLTEPRFVNGRFQASLHGVAGQSVVLQASTNLVDWESLRALTFQTEELDIEDTNSGGSAPRFYRLIPLSELD